jgi:RNA polymerase sigma-70 factor (ECF subfamily)
MQASERIRQETKWRQAALAGDEAAWRALYDRACAELWAYVLWRCAGLRDRAEEVVQETWLVAVRRLSDFEPARASFLTWLRGIAAQVLRNQLRAWRRRPAALTGQEPAPDTRDQRETAELIARALTELPERYEAVLRAKYLDLARVEQIAAEWNETPKAIESLLTRARQAFREAYEKRTMIDTHVKEAKP